MKIIGAVSRYTEKDLSQFVEEFIIFEKIGITGAGTEYVLKS